MTRLCAAMKGFDINPRIHPEHGAWGSTPGITEVDMPIETRCLALKAGEELVLWFAHDLCGNSTTDTDGFRAEIADAIGLPSDHVIWSTSQTHSSPTFPCTEMPGGSSITQRGKYDLEFCRKERKHFFEQCICAAKQAIESLEPVQLSFGKGYCDSVSYNSRFPMPTGGCKFSRNYAEGLQGGKEADPTVGLIRLESEDGRTIGVIFNFNCHPATMINDRFLSPDYVGTARAMIEEAVGAPAMFVQGFCGDVHPRYMFCKPEQAKLNGQRLGDAALQGLAQMVKADNEGLELMWETVSLPCRPMYSRQELLELQKQLVEFQREVKEYPFASWVTGINLPEFFSPEERSCMVDVQLKYIKEGLRILDAGEQPRSSLEITLGGLRMGNIFAALSPGENFALTGKKVREQSDHPFTLVCGDTNGLFGYIGDDTEIDRGGYETDSYWRMLYIDGFRLALAKGSTDIVIQSLVKQLRILGNKQT